jgi:hypothetical protein
MNEKTFSADEKPDVCRCQCQQGGACSRKICTGAAKLAADAAAAERKR